MNTQTYSTSFDIPVKLSNFPKSLQLSSEFPKEIRVLATGIGIDLMLQRWNPPNDTLNIDFRRFEDKRSFVSRENYGLIDQALRPGLRTVFAFPDSISLSYARKSNKHVPVVLDIELNLPPSYRNVGKLAPLKDTVLVVGPKDSLDRITEWRTARYRTPLLTRQQDLYVPLDTVPPFEVIPDKVVVPVNPVPFTEGTVSLPIRLTNVPRNTEVHLTPDSVRLKYLVPLSAFDEVRDTDFRLEVDFPEIDTRSDYVIPELVRKPKDVEIVGLTPLRMNYLIVTQE